jgi:hypothetical protein
MTEVLWIFDLRDQKQPMEWTYFDPGHVLDFQGIAFVFLNSGYPCSKICKRKEDDD